MDMTAANRRLPKPFMLISPLTLGTLPTGQWQLLSLSPMNFIGFE
jgi:hypothetical protein